MEDITGEDLPFAIFQVIGMEDYTFFDSVNLYYECDNVVEEEFFSFDNPGLMEIKRPALYLANQNCQLSSSNSNDSFNRNLSVSITAQFPSESRNIQDSSVLSKEKTK